jgi:hypothetical protein
MSRITTSGRVKRSSARASSAERSRATTSKPGIASSRAPAESRNVRLSSTSMIRMVVVIVVRDASAG